MQRIKIPLIAALLLSLGCSKIAAGGDDEVGEPPVDQDNFEFPGWIPASARLEFAPYNVALPGFENVPADLEYAAFAPASIAHPADVSIWFDANLADPSAKPWIWGVPDMTGYPARDGIDESHPLYEMLEVNTAGLTPEQQSDWLDGFLDIEPDRLPAVAQPYALRSGLIGNYALWITYSVPSTHPRPPIVWMNLLDLATHPFYAGRYNAYGTPCSTARGHGEDLYWGDLDLPPAEDPYYGEGDAGLMYSGPNADCKRAHYYYGSHQVGPQYSFVDGQYSVYAPDSIAQAVCLDNGGEYEVYNGDLLEGEFNGDLGNGAVLSAYERNWMVWVNGTEIAKLFKTLALQTPPPFDQLFVVLDILQSGGFNWTAWPISAGYRESMWSTTGVCAYPAQIEIDAECDWWTTLACPKTHLPIMPEFSKQGIEGQCIAANSIGDPFEPHVIDGFCTLPAWQVPPGFAAPSHPPIWGIDARPVDNDETGLGLPGGFVIGIADAVAEMAADVDAGATEAEAIGAWLAEVKLDLDLVAVTGGGIQLVPKTQDGRDFMRSVGMTTDDVIVAIGYGDEGIADPTIEQLGFYISTTFDENAIAMLTIDNDVRGTQRFHYLWPVNYDLDALDLATADAAD